MQFSFILVLGKKPSHLLFLKVIFKDIDKCEEGWNKTLPDLLVIQFLKIFLRGEECHMFSFRTKAPFKMKSLQIYKAVSLAEVRVSS